MDCNAEESENRRALEPIPNIRSLGFQLGARTLRIDADEDAYPLALAAIQKAGFDPKPVTVAGSNHAQGDIGDKKDDHSHDHQHQGFGSGTSR